MISALLPACIILFLLVFPSPIFASRSLTISSDKASLLGEEEMVVTASASGFTDGETIYIKGAFYQSGTSNYFGYTKNGDVWTKNSASNASQRSVKIGEWDGALIVKSDFVDSGYKGEGDYAFKVRFYYGSSFTPEWSANVIAITVNEPDPTITPTSTPTNTPTSTPTPSATSAPTATSVPTTVPTLTAAPTRAASITPTTRQEVVNTDMIEVPAILGVESDDATTEGVIESTASGRTNDKFVYTKSLIIALLFISTGIGFFAIASLLTKVDIWTIKEKNQ